MSVSACGYVQKNQRFTRSGNLYGEFSATSKASSEKEKRTCPRSNEFSATSKASSENEKRTFTRSGNVYGRFRSGIHVAYCIVMQNAI